MIWSPQPRQAAFMARTEDEALYGGAAGGGKSDALDHRGAAAGTHPALPGAHPAQDLPAAFGAASTRPCGTTSRCFRGRGTTARATARTFPSGAKKSISAALNHAQDKYNYQGKAFDFIGVDELTHFTWDEYSYVMSRNRPSGARHPGVHPGHGQPRRGGAWLGEGTVYQPGAGRDADSAAGEGKSAGRGRDHPAAHPHLYPVHRL